MRWGGDLGSHQHELYCLRAGLQHAEWSDMHSRAVLPPSIP